MNFLMTVNCNGNNTDRVHTSFARDVSSSYCGNIQRPHKIQTLQIYLYIWLADIFGLYKYICNRHSLTNIKTEARRERG